MRRSMREIFLFVMVIYQLLVMEIIHAILMASGVVQRSSRVSSYLFLFREAQLLLVVYGISTSLRNVINIQQEMK